MRYHSLWRRHKRDYDHQLFRQYRSKQNKLEPVCFRKFVKNVEDNIGHRIKEFWQYTKSLKKTNTYPNSFKLGERCGTDSKQIADMFADHFSSFYKDTTPVAQVQHHVPLTTRRMDTITIEQSKVQKALKDLDVNKGAGFDGIGPIFLKNTADSMCYPLTLLFQNSVNSGVFPETFKITKIHPIFKKGDHSLVENYRPIAILNSIEKLFERLIHDSLYDFVKPLISDKQHAFQKCRSTVSNLLEHVTFLSNSLDRHDQIDVIYADMSKAFDLVSHTVLCQKLGSFGITGFLLDWFRSYLSGRTVYVTFNGVLSKSFVPLSGVPQGSILGPLLFVMYMNDLPSQLRSTCSIFADDVKISRAIRNDDDATTLESDFLSLGEWCTANGLEINDNKCAVMTYSNKLQNIQHPYHRSTHDGYTYPGQASIRTLGFVLT